MLLSRDFKRGKKDSKQIFEIVLSFTKRELRALPIILYTQADCKGNSQIFRGIIYGILHL